MESEPESRVDHLVNIAKVRLGEFKMLRFGAAVFAILSVLTSAHMGAARPWRMADAAHVAQINDVQVSPDGRFVIYDVVKIDLAADQFSDAYFVAEAKTGNSRALTLGKRDVTNPRWSPDQSRIEFLSAVKNGTLQLWTVSSQGGAARQLTHAANSIASYAWSPDGRAIAATEFKQNGDDQDKQPTFVWLDPNSDIAAAGIPAQRTVWLIDARTGAQRRLINDAYSYGSAAQSPDPSWSADGTQVAVVRQPTPYYNDYEREKYVSIDVAHGTARSVAAQTFFALPSTAPPVYSPTGRRLAFVHTWDGTLAAREDVFVDGHDISAGFDHDFWTCASSQVQWSGGSVIASTMDGVSVGLYRLSPVDGAPQHLTPAGGSVQRFSASADGKMIAYVYSTPVRLPEVYVMRSDGTQPRQLTHVQHLPAALDIAKTQLIAWKAEDGHTLVGQLTLPASASSRTPLVVQPHGGPQCADDLSFNPFVQYLATNGYGVLRPSPHGSDGYGDWSYKAIVNDWGETPMRDVMVSVDEVVAKKLADPRHLFIDGDSYGGYLTTWIVTHTDRFRAAVAGVPVTDLRLDYTLSQSSNITKRFFGRRPTAANDERLRSESPQTYARSMNTPLLLQSGLKDRQAPFPQALEFYKTLVDYGKSVKMVGYPAAGHGPDDPAGNIDWFEQVAGWFQAHGGIKIPDALLPPRQRK
ncbi:MAG: S9 family peptidase [Candidatus Eremiobacteraeota bacterium]|nr:S9 family peptidase [Candidatus Eremiobacteraeota bacterium]